MSNPLSGRATGPCNGHGTACEPMVSMKWPRSLSWKSAVAPVTARCSSASRMPQETGFDQTPERLRRIESKRKEVPGLSHATPMPHPPRREQRGRWMERGCYYGIGFHHDPSSATLAMLRGRSFPAAGEGARKRKTRDTSKRMPLRACLLLNWLALFWSGWIT